MTDELLVTGASGRSYSFFMREMKDLSMLIDPHEMRSQVILVVDKDHTPVYATFAEQDPKEALLKGHMHLRYPDGYFGLLRVRDYEGAAAASDLWDAIRPA
jgi:hypothetical protein